MAPMERRPGEEQLSDDALRRLLGAIEAPGQHPDTAALALMAYGGLRVAEVAAFRQGC